MDQKTKHNYFCIGVISILIVSIFVLSFLFYTKTQELKMSIRDNNILTEVVGQKEAVIAEKEIVISERDITIENNQVQTADLGTSQQVCVDTLKKEEEITYFKNYMPVQYRFGQYQKAAQTFTAQYSRDIKGIEVESSFGVGGNIFLTLYQFSNDPEQVNFKDIENNTVLAQSIYSASSIVKQKPFTFEFEGPVTLEEGSQYVFVIETEDQVTQTSIAFADEDINETGTMYLYSRLIGGNGKLLQSKHSWQSRNSNDVLYCLISE